MASTALSRGSNAIIHAALHAPAAANSSSSSSSSNRWGGDREFRGQGEGEMSEAEGPRGNPSIIDRKARLSRISVVA